MNIIIKSIIVFSCLIKTLVFMSNKIGHVIFDSVRFLKKSIVADTMKYDNQKFITEKESEFV